MSVVAVSCPLCRASLTCTVDPGSSPSDRSGDDPMLDEITGCACKDSRLIHFDRYWNEVEELVLDQIYAPQ